MTNIDANDINKIAKFSRIRISAEEIDKFSNEITSILNVIDVLDKVNTDNIPVTVNVLSQEQDLREDVVTEGDIVEDILYNAKDAEFDCFTVPKVID